MSSCDKVTYFDDCEKEDNGISIYDYDFNIKTIDGTSYSLKKLKGKKIMIVNLASKCGLTHQCEALEELYKTYKDQNFIVLGFPSSDFLNQEFAQNDDIKKFYRENYAISFPIMEKTSVRGNRISPLYRFLINKKNNGLTNNVVTWNYQKYLIDEDGFISMIVQPKVSPKSSKIVEWVTKEFNNRKGCRISSHSSSSDLSKESCFSLKY